MFIVRKPPLVYEGPYVIYPKPERILMFDIWRIVAILMVVAIHMASSEYLNIPLLFQTYGFLGGISSITGLGGNIGNIGVELFIILSGCVLEHTYGRKIREAIGNFNYKAFIEKRIVHLYPAYWLSLILAILISPSIVSIGWIELLKTMSGFYIFQTLFSNMPNVQQPINPMGWFIGLMVSLYLLYPFLSRLLNNYKFSGLFLIFCISFIVRVTLLLQSPNGTDFYWFPLSRLFEFALGIYMVQKGLYFKTVTTNKTVKFLSDISFPMFLVHYIVISILITTPNFYFINILTYLIVVLILAVLIFRANGYFERIYYSELK